MAESDWGLGDVRSGPAMPGSSPSGMTASLYGAMQTLMRSPEFLSVLRQTHGLVPQNVGDIKASVAKKVPDGWLVCDGSEYAISAYPELYAAIGNTAGGQSGLTFRVPDLRNRVPRGAGATDVLSAYGGEDSHVLTTTEMPAHSHSETAPHYHASNDARTPYYGMTAGEYGFLSTMPGAQASYAGVIASAGGGGPGAFVYFIPSANPGPGIAGLQTVTGGQTTITVTADSGGGAGHNNVPAYCVLRFIIFTGV